MKISLLLLLLTSTAHAAESFDASQPRVLQLDSDFPVEKLGIPVAKPEKSEALPPAVQSRILKEAGLSTVEKWPALDQQILMGRAEFQELGLVHQKYKKKIPLEALEKLRRGIQNFRKTQKD